MPLTAIVIIASIVWTATALAVGKWFHALDICKECNESKRCFLPYVSAMFLWPVTLPVSIVKKLFKYQKCSVKARRMVPDNPYRNREHCSNCGAALIEESELSLVQLRIKGEVKKSA